jgi:hypothetical protein
MSKRWSRALSIALAGILFPSVQAAAEEPPATPSPPATSAPPSTSPPPEATALFDEAVSLMDQGNYEQACPKLEECLRMAGGIGTRFNLADCYSHVNRTASAWKGFQEVAAMAAAAGQTERAEVARQRAAALEPALSKIIVLVPPASAPTPGLSVLLDNAPMAPSAWGTPVPVDPGTHQIEAAAPGYQPWRTSIQVEAKPGTQSIALPPLVRDAAPLPVISQPAGPRKTAPPPEDTSAHPTGWTPRRIAAVAVGSVGVVGLALSAGLAVHAAAKRDSSYAECLPEDRNLCSTTGVKLRNEAFTASYVSTAAFVVGSAALAGGAVLFFTGSPDRTTGAKAALGAEAHPGGAGLTLAGRW